MFLEQHLAQREAKGSTKVFYGHTQRNFIDFFRAEKRLAEITLGDADDFATFLRKQELACGSKDSRMRPSRL